MLDIWGMRSTQSLSSLPGPLCPEVVSPDMVLSMGQIELFEILTVYFDIKMTCGQVNCLK